MAVAKKTSTTQGPTAVSPPVQISMRSELQRKTIHLSSISMPIAYIWISRPAMLWFLVPVLAIALIVEFLRWRIPAVESFIKKLFGQMLREHEKEGVKKISGATYVILSATLCVFLFPKVVTIAAFAVLIVSDTASALFGRRFGRHRFMEKSVEGSSAFVVTAIMVVLVVAAIYDAPWTFIAAGVVASFAAAVAEAMSYGVNVDDNLTIPLAFGVVIWGILALVGGSEIAAVLGAQ